MVETKYFNGRHVGTSHIIHGLQMMRVPCHKGKQKHGVFSNGGADMLFEEYWMKWWKSHVAVM